MGPFDRERQRHRGTDRGTETEAQRGAQREGHAERRVLSLTETLSVTHSGKGLAWHLPRAPPKGALTRRTACFDHKHSRKEGKGLGPFAEGEGVGNNSSGSSTRE